MILNKETVYTKGDKKLSIVRSFDAPVERVWKAWTEPEILDQWWAPKPYKANTQSQEFREGGVWRYYMEGPDGSRHYCRADYSQIVPQRSFQVIDAFCNEQGEINDEFPRMNWDARFIGQEDSTRVEITVSFHSEADLEKIVEMGFKEGFAMAHENLDQLLAENKV